ncbi:hypothetical protein RGRSB_1398 [cyanobacterium endosymbiont of Rhopalodia gibberula]|uniref:hypothetical protein n=1 Tax=cyanobacterium endosymbiont of Rhopalodia gibberula TaxID=1763363 RepID=UPI000DC6DA57|nr:hypothetical protein [cyanobacterium endosymbiont of Rhopalodia gibberula]BBA79832.1 hypothetical protein RGRSB_1398 [cyanobacterium endosymbiont of Rhopalodia gibberula]
MSHNHTSHPLPAPCIVDVGVIINNEDMRRVLNDLGHVHYIHTFDEEVQSEGEGWVVEVFSDSQQGTIIANRSLYLNVQSFDYLQLRRSPTQKTYFDLMQDHRCLRLIPIAHSSQTPELNSNLDVATLEAMVSQVLAAKWDVQSDNKDDDYPF